MSKISDLPVLVDGQVTGDEAAVIVKDGVTYRAALADIPAPRAEAAADKAEQDAALAHEVDDRTTGLITEALARESGFVKAWTNKVGKFIAGFDLSGKLVAKLSPQSEVPREALDYMAALAPESRYIGGFRDADGSVILGFTRQGIVARFAADCEFADEALATIAGQLPYSHSTDTASFGDSLTAQSRSYLAAIRPGLGGDSVGGHNAQEVAVLQGGREFPLTLSGDLPADTSTVTTTDFGGVDMLTENDPLGYRDGTLAGIPVRVSWVGGGGGNNDTLHYTVQRLTAAGAATTIPAATPFILDNAVAMRGRNQIVCVGRNGAKNDTADLLFIRDEVMKMRDYIAPYGGRMLVASVPNTDDEIIGTAGYDTIMELNAILANTFGGDFIDLREYMLRWAAYDGIALGLITGDDLSYDIQADIDIGRIPRILRQRDEFGAVTDPTHFASVGRELHARFNDRELRARGL